MTIPVSSPNDREAASGTPVDPNPTYAVAVASRTARPIGVRAKGADLSTPPVLMLDPGEALALASSLILAVRRWEGLD